MTEPKPGDVVTITHNDGKTQQGTWIPRPELVSTDKVVLKLKSGYNVGIEKKNIKTIQIDESYVHKEKKTHLVVQNSLLKKIIILHTGGTIASQVDYNTGGVVPHYDSKEFLELFPELQAIAHIDSKLVFQMFSEDLEPSHWKKLADAVEKEYHAGAKGVIITHGTDIIHYTSAILSFMLQNLPIPVLIVGSQRSPDRGSSDAYLNLFCAVKFLAETDFKGVGVCMHGSSNDDYCFIHLGVKVKKMHTSRRDTFRSINTLPIAKVTKEKIEYLREYNKISAGKFHVLGKFKKVGLLKSYPGMSHDAFKFFLDNNYDGLIIEGTGLGHLPINVLDDATAHHADLLALLTQMSKKMVIVMCSQCPYGSVDMNVYSTGRYLLKAGIIDGRDMTPETAYVKLSWLLGNFTEYQAREMINKNLVGEISERILYEADL
jgi:glutamyl-tRNA(Gln) amidotransferase subunit D